MVTASVTLLALFQLLLRIHFKVMKQELQTVVFTSIKECYLCKASEKEPGPLLLPVSAVPGSEHFCVSVRNNLAQIYPRVV